MEREGKFLVDQVEDGVVAPGRTKRNAPKVVTEEQLMAIASQPIKRSKKAAKQAEPSQSSKPITSFLNKKPLASFVCFPYRWALVVCFCWVQLQDVECSTGFWQ